MSSDYNSKCRTCLSESSSVYHQLFDYVDEHFKIIEMLDILVPQINVKNTTQFSTLVCLNCVEKLRSGYRFQQMCLETNNRLIELANTVIGTHPELEKETNSSTVQSYFIIKEEINEDYFSNPADNNWLLNKEIEVDPHLRTNNDEKIVCLAKKTNNNSEINSSVRVKEEKDEKLQMYDTNLSDDLHNELVHKQEAEITESIDENTNDGIEKNSKIIVKEELDIESETYDQNSDDYSDSELFTKSGAKIKVEKYFNGVEKNYKNICEVCNKKFRRLCDLKRHSAVHSLDRPFVCEICKYRYPDERILKIHYVKHKNEGEEDGCFECEVCHQVLISMPQLAKHVINKHPEIKKHKCDQCKSTFILHESLIKHINYRHKGDKKLKCSKCEKVFENDYKLREHMRLHIRYTCPHCDKICFGKTNLRLHIEKHEPNGKSYLCPQCGKTFPGKSNLRQHIKRHTTIKQYQCPECPQRFKCKSDVLEHAQVHLNAKPFECDICGSRFTRKRSMQKHKKLHTAESNFVCNQCNKRFKTNWSLKCHMNIHSGEKPHVCKYCERAFSRSGDLIKHLRLHIGEKTYICDQCPMAFKYQNEFRQHQSEHFKDAETHSQDSSKMFDKSQQDEAEASTGIATPNIIS